METFIRPETRQKNRRLLLGLILFAVLSAIIGALYLQYYGFPAERILIH
jgi:disulfide bond formation protein DsbB